MVPRSSSRHLVGLRLCRLRRRHRLSSRSPSSSSSIGLAHTTITSSSESGRATLSRWTPLKHRSPRTSRTRTRRRRAPLDDERGPLTIIVCLHPRRRPLSLWTNNCFLYRLLLGEILPPPPPRLIVLQNVFLSKGIFTTFRRRGGDSRRRPFFDIILFFFCSFFLFVFFVCSFVLCVTCGVARFLVVETKELDASRPLDSLLSRVCHQFGFPPPPVLYKRRHHFFDSKQKTTWKKTTNHHVVCFCDARENERLYHRGGARFVVVQRQQQQVTTLFFRTSGFLTMRAGIWKISKRLLH